MTTFGPETPTPFCVSSERHLRDSLKKLFKDNEYRTREKIKKCEWDALDYSDSVEFETKFCNSINKFLDIDCTDQILYIKAKGDEEPEHDLIQKNSCYKSNSLIKNWPLILEDKFCLEKPVDICEIKESESKSKFVDVIQIEKEPSFEFEFIKCDNKSKKYDKIIIKNCLKLFDDDRKYFCQFIMKFFKEQAQTKTSLLIIQRVGDLNTLPFNQQVTKEWKLKDVKYSKFIETMQNEFFSINYDIEVFHYLIDCKSTWYKKLKNHEPYPLNQHDLLTDKKSLTDSKEFVHGIRELNEGIFKYQQLDKHIELSDRMLFIGAFQQYNRESTLAERIKNKKEKIPYNPKNDLALDYEIRKLHMEITPDLRHLLNTVKTETNKTKRNNFF